MKLLFFTFGRPRFKRRPFLCFLGGCKMGAVPQTVTDAINKVATDADDLAAKTMAKADADVRQATATSDYGSAKSTYVSDLDAAHKALDEAFPAPTA